MMGYGRTDAPPVTQASDLAYYTFKRAADDIKELARQLGCKTVILGGARLGESSPLSLSFNAVPSQKAKFFGSTHHASLPKKGGAIVYRTALWHPTLVSHLFSVCTPYWAPTKTFTPMASVVETRMPDWDTSSTSRAARSRNASCPRRRSSSF